MLTYIIYSVEEIDYRARKIFIRALLTTSTLYMRDNVAISLGKRDKNIVIVSLVGLICMAQNFLTAMIIWED